jgi:hypothetical protein
VLHQAQVVEIYWGTYWGTSSGISDKSAMMAFFANFGTTGEYNTITQYNDGTGYIQLSNLTNTNWPDSTEPPTAVSDAAVQGEVLKYLGSHSFRDETIYEVFIGPGHYSSDGGGTSCGGSPLQYCAYHGSFSNAGRTIKYSIEPYPNCSGCVKTR